MKRICFVIPRTYYLFNPNAKNAEDKIGGSQKQAYLLSTSLANDKQFDVHFCMADFGQAEFEIRENVKLWNAFNFKAPIFMSISKLFKTLKKINAELYIFRSADLGVAIAVLYIRIFLRKKVLYMLAADAETTCKRLKEHSGFLTSFLMKLAYKSVNAITAQTKQQADIFEQNRKIKPKAVIKNIYLTKDLKQPIDLKEITLWVGRLDKIKNPYLFLELAKKYPEEKFIMIAPIVRDHIKYGESVQYDAKNIENLELINFVKPAEIQSYYKKAKIYVISSLLEGFSNTMAEAMMAHCPVLSYAVNPDTILNRFSFGYCANSEKELFFEYFAKLNSEGDLREKMGKNGARYIREYHQITKTVSEFSEILLNTLIL